MSESEELKRAQDALSSCESAVEKLHAVCCDPGRSPRMIALKETLKQVRLGLGVLESRPEKETGLFRELEDAGAQVGRLHVGCCAPDRLPLYREILNGLTSVQVAVNRHLGLGH